MVWIVSSISTIFLFVLLFVLHVNVHLIKNTSDTNYKESQGKEGKEFTIFQISSFMLSSSVYLIHWIRMKRRKKNSPILFSCFKFSSLCSIFLHRHSVSVAPYNEIVVVNECKEEMLFAFICLTFRIKYIFFVHILLWNAKIHHIGIISFGL